MSWRPRFLEALAAGLVEPVLLVDSRELGNVYGRDPLRISSRAFPGYAAILAEAGHGVSYGEVSPGTFDRSASTLTLACHVDPRAVLWRGQVVEVRMGFAGWMLADFEPIFLGQVRNCKLSGGRWTIELVDLVQGLASRFDDNASEESCLFYRLGDRDGAGTGETTLTDALLTGDSVAEVVDTEGFAREDGGTLVALVEPSTGDPFYVGGSGKTSTTLTGLVSGDLFGTTRVSAVAGDVVRACGYLEGHPVEIVRRVLVSTGTPAANGAYDVLPRSWGYGIPPEYLDEGDLADQAATCRPPTGTDPWCVIVEDPVENGITWLQSWLAPGGYWLEHRQGRITCRGLPDVTRRRAEVLITDADLARPPEYEAWDARLPVEALVVEVLGIETAEPFATEFYIGTRPVQRYRRITVPILGDSGSNAWFAYLAERVGQFFSRVPEVVRITCRGLRLAHLAPGDVVKLRTRHLDSLYARVGGSFDERQLLVLGGGPDWFGNTVSLTLVAVVPEAAESP